MSKRTDRRARTFGQRRVARSLIEVREIIRVQPFIWRAEVEYTYGRTSWTERVQFSVVLAEQPIIHVSDPDNPGDGKRTVMLTGDGRPDMTQFILDYLIAGRW